MRFNLDNEFETTDSKIELKFNDSIRITATTITPLLQIDETGNQRERYIIENGVHAQVPFYSANGLKGALRRMATATQIASMKESNPKAVISPETFYLYTSGSALDKKSVDEIINSENEMTIRKNAPILSLFGAGLSNIEGGLSISDLAPSSKVNKFRTFTTKDGQEIVKSALLDTNTFFRTDSIKDSGLWRTLVDYQDIAKWTADYGEKVRNGKKDKGDKKEENSHIQQPIEKNFIIAGVELTASINKKFNFSNDANPSSFSDLELGVIISSLLELSKRQIGSAKALSWGILDWTVEYNGEIMFEKITNKDYVLDFRINISDSGLKYINIWKNWLKENSNKFELKDIVS